MAPVTASESRQAIPSGDGLPDEISITADFSYYHGAGVDREIRRLKADDTINRRDFDGWDLNLFTYGGIWDRERILKAQREAEEIRATMPDVQASEAGTAGSGAVSGDIQALVELIKVQQEENRENAKMMRDVMRNVSDMTNAFRAIVTGASNDAPPASGKTSGKPKG